MPKLVNKSSFSKPKKAKNNGFCGEKNRSNDTSGFNPVTTKRNVNRDQTIILYPFWFFFNYSIGIFILLLQKLLLGIYLVKKKKGKWNKFEEIL